MNIVGWIPLKERAGKAVATALLFGAILLTLGAGRASASETHYCWGSTVTPSESCAPPLSFDAAWASGTEHSICLQPWFHHEKTKCTSGPGDSVYIDSTNPEGEPFAIIDNATGSTKVYGVGYYIPSRHETPPPPTWQTANLGGSFTSEMAVSSWGLNRLDVFGRGTDGAIWHKFWNGAWSEWDNGMGATNVVGGPDSASWGSGRIDVVARKSNKSVGHWYWSGSSWHEDNLGGTTESDPAISSWGENRLDVFCRSASNTLLHKYWNGSAWSGWEDLGGNLVGGPSAVSWAGNRIDVVGRNSKGEIEHWWWGGTYWASAPLGYSIQFDPSIASKEPGELDVFFDGTNNALWTFHYNGGWGGAGQIAGPISGGPDATGWNNGKLQVVAPNWDAQKSMLDVYTP